MSEIVLSPELLERCGDYGECCVANYRNGKKSTAQSFDGIEKDPVRQAEAKAAECAFAIWCGLDPVKAVDFNWVPDKGHDVVYGRARIDVKSIGERDRLLLWPYTKPADYAAKSLTALVVVRVIPPGFVVERWIDKASFERLKTIEGPGDPRGPHNLIPGTWFLPLAAMYPMASLRAYGELFKACQA